MNDNQHTEATLRQWQQSAEISFDETLNELERAAGHIKSQCNTRYGVSHIRRNWNRYSEAIETLTEIKAAFCKETEQVEHA